MGGWSRTAVLELYRALLRAGRNLEYTDRNYYRRAVAREFRRCQDLTVPEDKEDALKRGQFFLNSKLAYHVAFTTVITSSQPITNADPGTLRHQAQPLSNHNRQHVYEKK
ncbi:MIEF1 upstream open reading frame protein-like [Xyrichtys novacula]|uniref:MIEF1 upstream open reading frame protein-like n=1 Tax=Xyrichtys novacula TaxID=13765 RepID=A0AAV1GQR0_XYRNO|nr:MIEF1 upstream open reading frame protein-like [Xyrichtys novacula]